MLDWKSSRNHVMLRMDTQGGTAPLNPAFDELDNAVPLQGILGYLNFASGKPDPKKLFHQGTLYVVR